MSRIETTASRTAEWTCVARAASSLEPDYHLRTDDSVARQLVPKYVDLLLHTRLGRRLYKAIAPTGLFEYVVARTKYVDAAFQQALAERFDQILIFGAGFDTRALRFQQLSRNARLFELDVPTTQKAKIAQYNKRHLTIPGNLVFIPINFDTDLLPAKLEEAGFGKGRKSLFVMEGLLMYLQPESVDATFRVIEQFAGQGSRVVFDYLYASVIREENLYYGEQHVRAAVVRADERWHFGIERGMLEPFLSSYGLKLIDEKDASELEREFFTASTGAVLAHVNGSHALVTAEKA